MIGHRCADHAVNPNTETLIVGTFNPDNPCNSADFFYGRPQNAMWTILAKSKNVDDLKKKSKAEKIAFIHKYRIDFVDLISEIGHTPPNYQDRFLDRQSIIKWNDVIGIIAKLKSLKRICISRKGFSDIPNIKRHVDEISAFLSDKPIYFRCLHTPSRAHKRALPEWLDFLNR